MIEFRLPYLALLAFFGFLVWSSDYYNILKKPQIFFPKIFSQKYPKITRYKKHIIYLFGCIAWFLLAMALAGPRIPKGFSENKIKVNDLYFVIDVSRSMLAEDFEPNRIEVAKKKILDFINMRPTDRVGLIIFAREVFTLMPLTTDLSLVGDIVEDINVGLLGSATNIGDALGLGVARLIRSESNNKIIILMTDGVSNAGNMEPLDAALAAFKENIKVYTIGIGSTKGAKLPLGNGPFGKRYQNIPGGSIDLDLLRDIAKSTKAKSYLAEDEGALSDVLSEINELEKTEIKIKGQIIYKEIYLKYLISGVFLLVLVELLRKRILREIS